MRTRASLIYEFGPYRLDPNECRLSRHDQEVTLRPKLFNLLVVLVEHHGQMLDKDELIESVWTHTAVEDNNLTVSINALRRALGDEHYIETVSRRGYRFTAEVRAVPVKAAVVGLLQPEQDELEPPGGAVPLHSHLYVSRRADEEFYAALARHDSIVLVKGARQVGKTSLLARGLQQMREAGVTVVTTDFQRLTATAFETVDKLLLSLAELIAHDLDLPTAPHREWNGSLSPGSNFERFLRRDVLSCSPLLVWGLDEVDRLFNFDYASDFFGLIRSWHNLRALAPAGPWQRLTLALAYATEAHLFITDLNQSPFNVGTRLTLEDFTIEEVSDLNGRHGKPLKDEIELSRFYRLTGGHPYITRRGLYEMVRSNIGLDVIELRADSYDGVFGDHLRRMLVSLERDISLCASLREVLRGQGKLPMAHFYRLRSAGVLTGDSPQDSRPRCELYARYLKKCLL
jgi:DNA-binding winged helix-turn-helix (wHTH) protein